MVHRVALTVLTEIHLVPASPAKAAAAFHAYLPAFPREAPGRFRSRDDLSPFGTLETVVTMRSVSTGTVVEYQKVWTTGWLRPPIPFTLYHRAWRSTFRSWTNAIRRSLQQMDEPALT